MSEYRADMAEARLRLRLTQGEIARRCGVSRSAYQKYEYGQRTPTRPVQRKLTRCLSLPENFFREEML